MYDDGEYQYQHPNVLPLKPNVREIHSYILGSTPYSDDSYIIDRINNDSMPVRITIEAGSHLAKYNTFLIHSIELHQTESKKSAFKTSQRFKRYTFKVLSVKRKSSDKPIDVSSDNILLTPNEMYADRDEIKEYKANDLALPATKKSKTRTSTKKEEKQEKIIAILVNLLCKESTKAKSSKYSKGANNINVKTVAEDIIKISTLNGISDNLSSDKGLATEINAILKQYPMLKELKNI